MAIADWMVLGCFLLVAGLVGWVVIRHLAHQDQDPEMEKMWPEWWDESPPDAGGHPALEEKLENAVCRILSWAGAPAAQAPGLAGAASRVAA